MDIQDSRGTPPSHSSPDPDQGRDPEREQRTGRVFLAILRDGQGQERKITVRNISSHGLSARTHPKSPPLRAGESVIVVFGRDEEVAAEVRWARNNLIGVRLRRAIDPAAFNFAGKNWDEANQRFDPSHVFKQFRPVGRAYRPGLKPR